MGRRKVNGTDGVATVNQADTEVTEKKLQEKRLNNDEGKHTKEFNVDEEFQKLYEQAVKLGMTDDDLSRLTILHDISWKGSYTRIFVNGLIIIFIAFAVLYFAVLFTCLLDWPVSRETVVRAWMGLHNADIEFEPCIVNMPEYVSNMFRPPVECSFCENMTEVNTVYNISQEEFEELYAYTGVPVVVGDGTQNWTAPKYFSFEFFKEIYKEGSQALDNQENKCQFFPYKTSFSSLGEVMSMSPERAKMEDGSEPWYIGWSNCDFSAANLLRKHYTRPYFLPKLSESSKTDWMFMGSPGYGANLHIDNVGNPSWQAQITGTKRWTLEPPPECYYVCKNRIEVTVHPGQIIVLDTDIWYHSTLNVGKDISITIGSEYD
ncbi:uncharacterized protein LOC132713484 [Ruditapes philippinarum]|uniref:uncharacterized protein LOC132713484 n=1 Tax=Ruditapes philippinarum TaxID=129788 RepID=UPI00295A7F69|nr:uncharacterized protein LOC132713484 [Ruditapes philippinarum]